MLCRYCGTFEHKKIESSKMLLHDLESTQVLTLHDFLASLANKPEDPKDPKVGSEGVLVMGTHASTRVHDLVEALRTAGVDSWRRVVVPRGETLTSRKLVAQSSSFVLYMDSWKGSVCALQAQTIWSLLREVWGESGNRVVVTWNRKACWPVFLDAVQRASGDLGTLNLGLEAYGGVGDRDEQRVLARNVDGAIWEFLLCALHDYTQTCAHTEDVAVRLRTLVLEMKLRSVSMIPIMEALHQRSLGTRAMCVEM